MRVEMRDAAGADRRSHGIGLRGELALDVVDVDPSQRHAGKELAPRVQEVTALVDERRDLGRAQQRRVFADGGEMDSDAEVWGVAEPSGAAFERGSDGERGRRRHDAVGMSAQDRPAHAFGQPEVVGVDDQQPRRRGTIAHRWRRARSGSRSTLRIDGRRWVSSFTMFTMTAGDDSVEVPLSRGK